MIPISRLLLALQAIPDPGRAQDKRYPLNCLLLFTMLALFSGARSYRGIITFLEQRRVLLNRHFGIDLKRAPAVTRASRAISRLSSASVFAGTGSHHWVLDYTRSPDTSGSAAIDPVRSIH